MREVLVGGELGDGTETAVVSQGSHRIAETLENSGEMDQVLMIRGYFTGEGLGKG